MIEEFTDHHKDRPVLLTPGPLTTHEDVRRAAGVDWGSRDDDFTALTKQVTHQILAAAGADETIACVLMQGSGTFAVEAALRTFIPKRGGIIVGVNGAYGERMARLAERAGLKVTVVDHGYTEAIDPTRLVEALRKNPGYTHVGVTHCETSTGLLNPLPQIADAVHEAGARLIVDAMSTFGALDTLVNHPGVDAVVAASGKCLEGLPGVGIVLSPRMVLAGADGRCDSLSLDLADQFTHMESTGQWRFTPPTHVVAGLAAAMEIFEAEGGRTGRLRRYQANSQALAEAAAQSGLHPYLPQELQAPVIHTFFAPQTDDWSFPTLYALVKRRGFILYPGKLTKEETFRVGCIGRVTPDTMRDAVGAIGAGLAEMRLITTGAAR